MAKTVMTYQPVDRNGVALGEPVTVEGRKVEDRIIFDVKSPVNMKPGDYWAVHVKNVPLGD